MAASRSSWKGAIQFAGFPMHVAAYPLVESPGAQSFKTLCACHHKPINAPRVCAETRTELDAEGQVKAVEVAKGKFVALTPEQVASVQSAERSSVLEIHGLPLLSTLPMHLVTGHYRIVPDDKVAGAAGPVEILWNGLRASGRALVSEWTMRAGSRPQIVVIHADQYGLTANTLPYATSLKDTPEWLPVENEQAAQMFEQFAGVQGISMDSFVHATVEDTYATRRKAAIDAALAGETLAPAENAAPAPAVPDLMAAMQAALASSPPAAKAPAKKRAAKPKAVKS